VLIKAAGVAAICSGLRNCPALPFFEPLEYFELLLAYTETEFPVRRHGKELRHLAWIACLFGFLFLRYFSQATPGGGAEIGLSLLICAERGAVRRSCRWRSSPPPFPL